MDNEKLNTIEAEYTSTRLKEIIDNPIKAILILTICAACTTIFFRIYMIGQASQES